MPTYEEGPEMETTAKSEAPTGRALAELHKNVEALEKLANQVRDRLTPILSQHPEVAEKPETLRDSYGSSNLVLVIGELDLKVQNITRVLRDIRNRAEC